MVITSKKSFFCAPQKLSEENHYCVKVGATKANSTILFIHEWYFQRRNVAQTQALGEMQISLWQLFCFYLLTNAQKNDVKCDLILRYIKRCINSFIFLSIYLLFYLLANVQQNDVNSDLVPTQVYKQALYKFIHSLVYSLFIHAVVRTFSFVSPLIFRDLDTYIRKQVSPPNFINLFQQSVI